MIFGATTADIHLFHRALKAWGLTTQINKVFEETAELNIELARGLIWGYPDLEKTADEIADVYIMLHQLAYGLEINEKVNKRVEYKMERLLHIIRACSDDS